MRLPAAGRLPGGHQEGLCARLQGVQEQLRRQRARQELPQVRKLPAHRQGTEDKAEAHRYYLKGCEAGCAKACFGVGLGLTAKEGESGVARDVDQGLAFFSRACDMGSPDGCYFASSLFITGTDLPRDMRRAFRFAERACELKNMQACTNVALMYERGQGVQKDPAQAKRYRELVADYEEQLKQSRGIEMEQGIKD
ncbi:cytochrome c oxidase assembly factor 7 isoform X2 [Amblyomma americanum]